MRGRGRQASTDGWDEDRNDNLTIALSRSSRRRCDPRVVGRGRGGREHAGVATVASKYMYCMWGTRVKRVKETDFSSQFCQVDEATRQQFSDLCFLGYFRCSSRLHYLSPCTAGLNLRRWGTMRAVSCGLTERLLQKTTIRKGPLPDAAATPRTLHRVHTIPLYAMRESVRYIALVWPLICRMKWNQGRGVVEEVVYNSKTPRYCDYSHS